MNEWISVHDRMPEEHESIFFKLWGTDKWRDGMFRRRSDTVIACVEFEDGSKIVRPAHTNDGVWRFDYVMKRHRITHWMPLPKPPKGE